MRSYIIHLKRAAARAENVAHLRKTLPQAEVIDAMDWQEPQVAKSGEKLVRRIHRPPYPFALNEAEIACFMSHRHVWHRIMEGDDPFALVVEDDLQVDPKLFKAALALAKRYADEDSFIQLPRRSRTVNKSALARQDGAALVLPRNIGLGAVCQIVGRRAAARMLNTSMTIDRPVDTLLQMHWVTGQPVHAIQPSGVSEMGAPSTIQSKTRARDVLLREVRRATYRALVRSKPQRA